LCSLFVVVASTLNALYIDCIAFVFWYMHCVCCFYLWYFMYWLHCFLSLFFDMIMLILICDCPSCICLRCCDWFGWRDGCCGLRLQLRTMDYGLRTTTTTTTTWNGKPRYWWECKILEPSQ
jgi:hypothetical protein